MIFSLGVVGGHSLSPKTGSQLLIGRYLSISALKKFFFNHVLPLLPDLLLWGSSHGFPSLASSSNYTI